MDYRSAKIYVRKLYAGILSETEEGYECQYSSEYLSNWEASPVSLTLPLREEKYFSKTLFSFFDGLIPEGWLLNVVTHNWKLDPKDRFGILLIACKDSFDSVFYDCNCKEENIDEMAESGKILKSQWGWGKMGWTLSSRQTKI